MNFKYLLVPTLILFIILSGVFYYYNSSPFNMQDETFLIKSGESLSSVAIRLYKRNLITDKRFFVILAMITGNSNILIGKYKIHKGMSSIEILGKLSSGDIIRKRVTIPEGFNLYEIADKLHQSNITNRDDFLHYSFDKDFLNSIGINHSSAEGFLFPDTYLFAEDQDPREILAVMHKQFRDVLNSIDLTNMNSLNLDEYQLLIFASLVEKEAKLASERTLISAVFHNRLKRGIKLYCDPTVRYAVKKFSGRIRYRDLKYDSPFNTYLYHGLPPTPISSVGRESIIAALNPENSNFLYFVARNDGSHHFSKSLREHNRAVDYYQKGIDNGFADRQGH